MSLAFDPGEIHALLGENGAGKSTLANVLDGAVRPDAGVVSVPGTVGHVHQHFAIPPGLTTAECMAVEEKGLRRWGRAALARRLREIETATGIEVGDPEAEAAQLPVGARQRLEFARALSRKPDLLLLDEPTAVLAPAEIEAFSSSVRAAARGGMAVVFITHKLPEVFAVADRVSLLRRGRLVLSKPAAETSAEEVAAAFLEDAPPIVRAGREPGETMFAIEGASTAPRGRGTRLDAVSIAVRRREIAAIVGVDGNGQEEIADLVTGLRSPARGSVTLAGASVGQGGFRRSGCAVVPGDRRREGLILDFSIADNLRLVEPIPPADRDAAARRIEEYAIVAASPDQPVRALSGGNQQKVVLARELSREPRFLLAVSPTRGLDLASSRSTLAMLNAVADRGGAVLLVTTDLDEARAVADATYVLYRGRLSAPFSPGAPASELGRAMAGLAR